jgi:hypothetical protein
MALLENSLRTGCRTLLIWGLFLAAGPFGQGLPQGNSPIFLLEVPEGNVPATNQPVVNLPSAEVKQILIHILRPEADSIDYGQIYSHVNGAAASRISEARPSERGKLIRINVMLRPGFQLLPGLNKVEVQATDHHNRQYQASFVLHTPKGVCSGGGSAKILSLQKITDALRAGIATERLVQYVIDCGVDFHITDATEQNLRNAGAEDRLTLAIRNPTAPEFAEYQSKGLRSDEITQLLRSGLPQDWIVNEVEDRGVSFTYNDALGQKLREAGANEKLLAAVRYMAGEESVASASKGLRAEEIIDLLKGGVDKNRVFDLVRQRGVSFRLDNQIEQKLREAGANEKLMLAIRKASDDYAASH